LSAYSPCPPAIALLLFLPLKNGPAHGEQLVTWIRWRARFAAVFLREASTAVNALSAPQDAFNAVSLELGNVKGEITCCRRPPAPRAAAAQAGPAVPVQ
jgi:hypothetical protein